MEDEIIGGRFITVESAVVGTAVRIAAKLSAALDEQGVDLVQVPRFSAGLAGTALTNGYSADPFLRISPVAEVLLMSADAAFLTERSIAPAIKAGRWVLKPGYMDTIAATLVPRLQEDDVENEEYRRLKSWLKTAVVPFAVSPDLAIIIIEDVAAALDRASLERGWRVRPADVKLAEEIQRRLTSLPKEHRLFIEMGRDEDRFVKDMLKTIRGLEGPGIAGERLARGMRTLDQFDEG